WAAEGCTFTIRHRVRSLKALRRQRTGESEGRIGHRAESCSMTSPIATAATKSLRCRGDRPENPGRASGLSVSGAMNLGHERSNHGHRHLARKSARRLSKSANEL